MADSVGISTTVPIGGGDVLSMGISMLVVLAAVVGLGWLYSRLRLSSGGRTDVIRIIASHGLGPKERLLLVQVEDQQLLIGMTAAQLSTLHSFDKPIVASSNETPVGNFSDRLRSAVRGGRQ